MTGSERSNLAQSPIPDHFSAQEWFRRGPANSTSTITQYLYNYGLKSLDFGFGSAGAIVMTVLVLLLSSVYIKRAIS